MRVWFSRFFVRSVGTTMQRALPGTLSKATVMTTS
jgi:hypothetical protein